MQNQIHDGVWQTASTNKGNELKHYQLHLRTVELMGDTMVLVSVSRSKFYKRYRWKKQAHEYDETR